MQVNPSIFAISLNNIKEHFFDIVLFPISRYTVYPRLFQDPTNYCNLQEKRDINLFQLLIFVMSSSRFALYTSFNSHIRYNTHYVSIIVRFRLLTHKNSRYSYCIGSYILLFLLYLIPVCYVSYAWTTRMSITFDKKDDANISDHIIASKYTMHPLSQQDTASKGNVY